MARCVILLFARLPMARGPMTLIARVDRGRDGVIMLMELKTRRRLRPCYPDRK